MHDSRMSAACAVYDRKIVVSGGKYRRMYDVRTSNTVEAYDVAADEWKRMPSMIEKRYDHKLVVVRDKLFVIGWLFKRTMCEYFDKASNMFVALQTPSWFFTHHINEVLSIGTEIFIFQSSSTDVVVYDVEKNTWTKKTCEAIKGISLYSCVKIPIY